MATTMPTIGDWYQQPGGDLLEVVAMDESDGTIEIQYFDGTIEETDFDGWTEMNCLPAEAPEDFSGSLDIEREDYGVELDLPAAPEWSDPLDWLDQSE